MQKHLYEHVTISPRGVYRVTLDQVPGGYHVAETCPHWSAEHTYKEQAPALDWAEHLAELHDHDAAEDERAEARNLEERRRAILAMEYLARQVNDETALESWLMDGVPDGDIPYMTTDPAQVPDLDDLAEPETFAGLLDAFTWTMSRARKSGGLYCGGVCGGERDADERKASGTRKAYEVLNLVSSYLDDLARPHLFATPDDVAQRADEHLARIDKLPEELREYISEVIHKACDLVSQKAE